MIKSNKSVGILVFILLMMMVVTACGGNASNNGSNTSQNNAPAENAGNNQQEAPANQDVRVVQHAMGETPIEGTPIRVVTLYQGATDAAVALGVTPVGIVESWVQQPVYEYLREDLKDVPIVGLETQPNLEEINKLNPDLIIASKTRHEKIYDQLSQIAPTVTHETVYKFKETVELMGQAMNLEDKANELLSDWDQRVNDFKEKIAVELGSEWPIELSVVNFRADHARIYVDGFAPAILNELGFTFPEYQQEERAKGTVVVSLTDKESIPSMNANVFFMFNFDDSGDEAVQKSYQEWTSHPLWNNLDAVKNDRVYKVDEVFWNNGGGYISANKMLDQVYDHFGLEK